MRLLLLLCCGLWLSALPAQSPAPTAKPAAVLDPISRPPAGEPPLPEGAGFPADVDQYENPLLLFDGARRDLPVAETPDPDLLPPLAPQPPAGSPEAPLTPEQLRLRTLGAKVAASVVGLRVWDEFGTELSRGIGCFVTRDGILLTDTGLLHPEIAGRVSYITTLSADGSSHKIRGFYLADLATGVTLLQSEARATEPIEFVTGADFRQSQPCHVLALSEQRGLVLAEASVQADSALTGLGWLNLRGSDSPGAVGSPVLAADGRVLAVVGMQVPLRSWMNFALPADAAALALRQQRAPLQPLDRLPQRPRLQEVSADPEFLAAFHALRHRRVESAMRRLVQLARKYPRSAECWALLGLSASHLGAGPEALNCQRKAVALDPKAGLYWHQLALAKLRETPGAAPQSDEDREALELAVEQRPNDQLAWLLLASRHVRDGNLGQAEEALERVTLLAPDYAQGHYLRAYVRGRRQDYQGAQAAIRQSLALDSGSAEAWYYQGLLLDRAGAPAEAAKAYRNAVRLRPAHPQAGLNLAYALKKAGRQAEAREAFAAHQRRRR